MGSAVSTLLPFSVLRLSSRSVYLLCVWFTVGFFSVAFLVKETKGSKDSLLADSATDSPSLFNRWVVLAIVLYGRDGLGRVMCRC